MAASGDTWQIEITATGQDLPLANKVSTIYIGVAETATTYPTPAPPPNYTVDLRIKGDLFKDIKEIDPGYGYKVWNLLVEVGTYADYAMAGYFPQLHWNPAQIGAGTLELRQGDTEYGKLLIEDMSTRDTYQTKEADGSYIPSVDRAFLQYTIIYVPLGSATTTYYHDKDNDSYGDPNDKIETVVKPSGYVTDNTDCDDARAYVYPGKPEVCDGDDNDCDDQIDEGFDLGQPCMVGLGACQREGFEVCREDGTGTVCSGVAGEPAVEVCDGEDNDCDGQIDEGVLVRFYFDGDGDGYGDPDVGVEGCNPPPQYVANGIDCNDNDQDINPMRSVNGGSLREIEYGRNLFPSLYFSCSPYTSFDLLSDFKELGITVSLHYTTSHLNATSHPGPISSTYWFFGQVSGDKNKDQGLYIIDRLP